MTDGPVVEPPPATMRPGERAVVRLGANPSTGYSWAVATEGPISAEEPRFVPGSLQRPGAPGTTSVAIVAQAPGTARVIAEYRRPWESGPAAIRHVWTIEVRPAGAAPSSGGKSPSSPI
ncbi:MAG: protease inhibitor I42 family protein [Thermoplasmata archaeon]